MVVATGGTWDGQDLAAALVMGAVGTRFVTSEEAGCSRAHKEAVVEAGWGDTMRTLVVSGRLLRVRRKGYVAGWEGGGGESEGFDGGDGCLWRGTLKRGWRWRWRF